MIGWLSGKVREIDPIGMVLLDVHGVGYEVTVSLQTLCDLQVGGEAELSIHTYVREDQFLLFGFVSQTDRTLFRLLNKVSGVGARMALNLMSSMSASELSQAIEHADDLAIARTPGVGKKTAQRLILELKGKLESSANSSAMIAHPSNQYQLQDVKSALLNLGYKAPQVDKALASIDVELGFEACFKAALKQMV